MDDDKPISIGVLIDFIFSSLSYFFYAALISCSLKIIVLIISVHFELSCLCIIHFVVDCLFLLCFLRPGSCCTQFINELVADQAMLKNLSPFI